MYKILPFILILIALILIPLKINAQYDKNLNVSAVVPAQPTDFETSITRINPAGPGPFEENAELTYEVSYGSHLSYPVSFTLKAAWTEGTIQGNLSPTVDVAHYVVGSATNAYNSAQPIIDTINRTITWNIVDFPANTTGETITFKLITTNNYIGTLPVTFEASSQIVGPGTETTPSTVTTTYQFSGIIPTPTPTITPTPATPSLTPGPGPTSTPNPATPTPSSPITPTPQKEFSFTEIDVLQKTSTTAQIVAKTNENSLVTLVYGTSPNRLTNSITTTIYDLTHLLDLTELTPSTQYYFRVSARNAQGQNIQSDIFTFTTASQDTTTTLDVGTLIATSEKVTIYESLLAQTVGTTIIVPTSTVFEVRIGVLNDSFLESASLYLAPRVLGAKSTDTESQLVTQSVELVEVQPGVFFGRLKSNSTAGSYTLMSRVIDTNGNIVIKKVSDVKVIDFMSIHNSSSKQAIDGARVQFFVFNYITNSYTLISPQNIAIRNPQYSNYAGEIQTVLPPGRYKAIIKAAGFEEKTVEFIIGTKPSEVFPKVMMTPQVFGIPMILNSIGLIATNLLDQIYPASQTLFDIPQLMTVVSFAALFLLIILSFLALSARFSIRTIMLPYFLFYHLVHLFKHNNHAHIVTGVIVDSTSEIGIANCIVYILNKRNKVLAHGLTNAFGEFYIKVSREASYKIHPTHTDYKNNTETIVAEEEMKNHIKIEIQPEEKPVVMRSATTLMWYVKHFSESILEVLILASIILAFYTIERYGLLATLPFALISLCNLFLAIMLVKIKRGN